MVGRQAALDAGHEHHSMVGAAFAVGRRRVRVAVAVLRDPFGRRLRRTPLRTGTRARSRARSHTPGRERRPPGGFERGTRRRARSRRCRARARRADHGVRSTRSRDAEDRSSAPGARRSRDRPARTATSDRRTCRRRAARSARPSRRAPAPTPPAVPTTSPAATRLAAAHRDRREERVRRAQAPRVRDDDVERPRDGAGERDDTGPGRPHRRTRRRGEIAPRWPAPNRDSGGSNGRATGPSTGRTHDRSRAAPGRPPARCPRRAPPQRQRRARRPRSRAPRRNPITSHDRDEHDSGKRRRVGADDRGNAGDVTRRVRPAKGPSGDDAAFGQRLREPRAQLEDRLGVDLARRGSR